MLHPSDTENKSVTLQTLKMFFNPQTLKTLYNYFFQHPVHVWLGSSSMCAVFYLCPCQHHCHAPRLQLAPCISRYCTNEGVRSKRICLFNPSFLGLLFNFTLMVSQLHFQTESGGKNTCRLRILLSFLPLGLSSTASESCNPKLAIS